jgi:Alkylmercury lyase
VIDTENRVRLHLYERFAADGRPPTVAETAEALGEGEGEIAEAYRRLEQSHVIVLAPGTLDVWMANPLSAVPTPFRVETEKGGYFGNCVWDAFGIPAMLGVDARVETVCPDCGERLTFSVRDGELEPADAIAHFAVPAARWWENIAYT